MIKKPIISEVQLLFMSVGSALVFPYTFLPILNTPPANQDVWIVLLMSFVYILFINFPLLFVMNKFRGMNVNEVTETTLGKLFGKVAAIIFILFFVYCFCACMLITAIFINLYIFPNAQTWAILLIMIIPVSYASYKGAGTIGRLATFIVSFVILTIVIFFILGLSKMDINILRPILSDSTFLELNQGAFFTASRYSEILIFFVFSFYLGKNVSINKTYFSALLLFAVSFMLILFPTLLTLGIELAKKSWNPYYIYTRQVEAFTYLERVQSINTLAWFPQSILKLTLYNYMASYVFSGVVKAKTHKYFVVPFSIMAFIVCLLPILNKSSTVELLRSDQVFPWIILPVIFVVPLILLIVYLIRKKKIDPIIKEKQSTEASANQ